MIFCAILYMRGTLAFSGLIFPYFGVKNSFYFQTSYIIDTQPFGSCNVKFMKANSQKFKQRVTYCSNCILSWVNSEHIKSQVSWQNILDFERYWQIDCGRWLKYSSGYFEAKNIAWMEDKKIIFLKNSQPRNCVI